MDKIYELTRDAMILFGLALSSWSGESVKWLAGDKWWVLWVRIGILLGVFFIILFLDRILPRLQSLKSIRRFRCLESHFEGIWFEKVGVSARPYSICTIKYCSNTKMWIYSGVGYNKDFKPAAEFRTYSKHYDKENGRWLFAGTAQLLRLDEVGGYTTAFTGEVIPILKLPEDRTDNKVVGTVVDIRVGGKDEVFHILLYRADSLYQGKMPSIEDLKYYKPDEVEGLFRQMGNLIITPSDVRS